jgi:DNA-directed RNA polymerase subunit RPC12/RpoP
MKLESLDELEQNQRFFCWSCGKQLGAVDEISQRICFQCKQSLKESKDNDLFFCWACGKQLSQMSEVAQGVCHPCKASIIRKIRSPDRNVISSSNKQ